MFSLRISVSILLLSALAVVAGVSETVPTSIFGNTHNSFPCFQCARSFFLFVKAGFSRTSPPLFGKPWSLSSALLAGDISPNPGPTQNVTLAFTNIRSISNKYPSIANYVQANDVQAFGLSETWLSDDATPSFIAEITPPGFSFHHKPRSD